MGIVSFNLDLEGDVLFTKHINVLHLFLSDNVLFSLKFKGKYPVQ